LFNAETLEKLRQIWGAKPAISIELEVLGQRITGEEIKLLLEILERGSMSKIASERGVSYRTVWLRIEEMENKLGFRLLERQRGGIGGGRDILTLPAQALIERYRVLSELAWRNIEKAGLEPGLRIYGSDCPGVELLVQLLEEKGKIVEYLRAGSQLGLELLREGYADVTGIHIVDSQTGKYNTHVLRKHDKRDLVLIRGYSRDIGFIVERGNPKNILHPEDLLRRDVVLANRNKESGTYLLLQYILREMSRKYRIPTQALKRRIRGFDTGYYSHKEAALAVLNGKADVTIGPRWIAKELRLEFVPLVREKFDFVARRELLEKDILKELISVLTSPSFGEKASQMGIHVSPETGTIVYREELVETRRPGQRETEKNRRQ